MVTAKSECDNLENRLHQLFYILSDVVAQPAPAEPAEIESAYGSSADNELDTIANPTGAVERTERLDIRYYQRARGFYVDSKQFRVLAGSKARSAPSTTFDSIESLSNLRDRLISSGVLTRDNEWDDYEFTRDYTFGSPSAAASVVDGNSRSGPQSWGRPRTHCSH